MLACGLERTLSSSYIVWMNIRKLFGNQPKQFSYIQFLVYVSRMTLESEIDIYIDGHAPCRICVAKFGVKEKNPNQVRLCNYSTMVDPARTLGRRVAELARDWNGEKMGQLHGTKEFCRNVCLLMGLNAMLGYIYIYMKEFDQKCALQK